MNVDDLKRRCFEHVEEQEEQSLSNVDDLKRSKQVFSNVVFCE